MLLSPDQVRMFQMLHRRTFVVVCDRCDTLIPAGELYLTEKRRKVKGQTQDERHLCMDTKACLRKVDVNAASAPDAYDEPKTKRRSSKRAVLQEKLGDVTIEPSVRRAVIRILREDTESKFDTKLLVTRLLRKSSMREFKKGLLRSTIKGMRIKKEIKRRKGFWTLLLKEKVEA